MTATPGVWYHGSPNPYILELESGDGIAEPTVNFKDRLWEAKWGIYFTQCRRFAEGFALPEGRVYDVELNTRNPLILEGQQDKSAVWYEQLLSRVADGAHDCIVIPHNDELILLDKSCIRYLCRLVSRPQTCTPGIFYRGDYDPRDCGEGLIYTKSDCWASAHAGGKRWTPRLDLITKRPAHLPAPAPPPRMRRLVTKLAAKGFDCIVFHAPPHKDSVMVLDAKCVRQLDNGWGFQE